MTMLEDNKDGSVWLTKWTADEETPTFENLPERPKWPPAEFCL